jgi:hypothetical protein
MGTLSIIVFVLMVFILSKILEHWGMKAVPDTCGRTCEAAALCGAYKKMPGCGGEPAIRAFTN